MRELWTEAFGEDEAYASAFFKRHFVPENSLVYEEDGVLCGMLHTVCTALFSRPARYLYAIATKRTHRSRGIFSALHEEALSRFDEEVFFLIPENESLFSFYAARGYRTFATRPVLSEEVGEELSLSEAWERYRSDLPSGIALTREQFETTSLDKRFFAHPRHPFVLRLLSGKHTSFYPDGSVPSEANAMALFRSGKFEETTIPCFLN